MIQALLRKQFLELNSFYFQNRKTGKNRQKKATIAFIALFAYIFLAIGFSIFGMGKLLASSFVPLGLDWLYFAVMGLLAIVLGVFGDVFNTYTSLYNAKDNDLLLSMPIPVSRILLVRLAGVYAMGMLYESIVFIPAMLAYWLAASVTVASVLFPIITLILIGFLVLVLTCGIGFVLATVTSKVKNKSIISVIFSVLILALYYFAYFRLNSILGSLVENAQTIGDTVQAKAYPLYAFGLAACGHGKQMLLVFGCIGLLFSATYAIMNKTFISLVTTKRGAKKAKYHEKDAKANTVKSALLKRELKHFVSSPAYLLNAGLGLIVLLAMSVFALIRAQWLRDFIVGFSTEISGIQYLIPALALMVVALITSMNAITASSVSLEGKTIWILQSLPVDIKEVLSAKMRMHILLNTIPAVCCTVVLGLVVWATPPMLLCMVVYMVAYIQFLAALGLLLNLKMPNLNWTNETVPVKQSMSVALSLFSGWGIATFSCVLYYIGIVVLGPLGFLSLLLPTAALWIGQKRMVRWIHRQGVEIFSTL